jgi:hypothetical protein
VRALPLALSLVLAALASPVLAQMGGLGGPTTVETEQKTALGKLPRPIVDWMTEESVRQATRPGDLEDLEAQITEGLGDQLEAGARRARMDVPDLVSVIRYQVVREAGRLLGEDIRARQKLAGDTPTDDEMLAIETAISHRQRMRVLEEQAERRLTRKAAAFLD